MNPKIGKAYLALVIGVLLLVINNINITQKDMAIIAPIKGEVINATITLNNQFPLILLHPTAQRPPVAIPNTINYVTETGIPKMVITKQQNADDPNAAAILKP